MAGLLPRALAPSRASLPRRRRPGPASRPVWALLPPLASFVSFVVPSPVPTTASASLDALLKAHPKWTLRQVEHETHGASARPALPRRSSHSLTRHSLTRTRPRSRRAGRHDAVASRRLRRAFAVGHTQSHFLDSLQNELYQGGEKARPPARRHARAQPAGLLLLL